jgi:nicotinic acid phosphoribosyltransferase
MFAFAADAAALESPDIPKLARAALLKQGLNDRDFVLKAPRPGTKPHSWWVFAIAKGSTSRQADGQFVSVVPADGDYLIVIDERTLSACVQQAIAAGPCT